MHNASRRDPRPDIHYPQMVMNISRHARALACIASVAALLVTAGGALAQNTNAKIANTRHNLSASGSGGVKSNATTSGGTDQICVFCHTPHAANAAAPGPLWNRNLSTQTYTEYTSNSLDAEDILGGGLSEPGGASKLCLSCHDGTLAIGQVSNAPGSGMGSAISMTGTRSTASAPFVVGGMPAGSGDTTGYTRNLGVNLTNDHPISFTFQNPPPATTTDVLSQRDGELRSPPYSVTVNGQTKTVVGIRSPGNKPMLPLDHEGKVQCTSCHDPHLDASKFLRLNRFQQNASAGTNFNPANDQICLGCHDRNLGNGVWSNSAHANSSLTAYAYTSAASTQRGFPADIKVWEAGCLNCHDTHSVQGSRRLLREGTDDTNTPKAGGNPAIEETCYQCHSNSPIITNTTLTTTSGVPDIKTEFTGANRKRMPITNTDQRVTTEQHDIGGNFNDTAFINCTTSNNECGADFIESREKLGNISHTNRHVECTDCHNPHRVIKNALFNGQGASTRRTHVPAAGTNGADGNVASGALRGAWGIEPTYTPTNSWLQDTINYTVKRGDPGASTGTAKSNTYMTREYQLCLKCHSDYGAGLTMPVLGNTLGGTASGTNGLSEYTNVAAEFSAYANDSLTGADQGEDGNDTTYTPGTTNGAPNGAPTNHRSWHPVIFPTGRTRRERTNSTTSGAFSNIRAPFNVDANIGKQTMQCSDCHGETTSWTQGTTLSDANNGPNLTKVQGPHGSTENFLLKGKWDITLTINSASGNNSAGNICGRCHDPINGGGGFSSGDAAHSKGDHSGTNSRCMFCHVAVPHGWKNKAFLANLNCIGPEAGRTSCKNAFNEADEEKTRQLWAAPYYNGALLRIQTWRASRAWTEDSCGSGPNKTGGGWMSGACELARSGGTTSGGTPRATVPAGTTQQPQSSGY